MNWLDRCAVTCARIGARKGHEHANRILRRAGLPEVDEDPWCDICNLPRPTRLNPDASLLHPIRPLERTRCLLEH
jgi:hypothetical protein